MNIQIHFFQFVYYYFFNSVPCILNCYSCLLEVLPLHNKKNARDPAAITAIFLLQNICEKPAAIGKVSANSLQILLTRLHQQDREGEEIFLILNPLTFSYLKNKINLVHVMVKFLLYCTVQYVHTYSSLLTNFFLSDQLQKRKAAAGNSVTRNALSHWLAETHVTQKAHSYWLAGKKALSYWLSLLSQDKLLSAG